MAAAQKTGNYEQEDKSNKRMHGSQALVDDLHTAIKKLRVNAKSEDHPVDPGLHKPHLRKHHLSGRSRKSRLRRASKSLSETNTTPTLPGTSDDQGDKTSARHPMVRSVKKTSSAPDLTCAPDQTGPPQDDTTVNELAAYFENLVHIPREMSAMAEMMYT
ncbi:hypothetical protein HPB49_024813 [Dermacentor silvarum]|uniref:Uncharacterized protein n=1 Tax=Dermacentor silvarum TaxID=543639 RepID=A0ACB8E497_DERSI|nr:oxidative stress-responsive serine-rich protein 1 [Dermacentor silvarum]KAH7981502.1 hypothetical protein HPB49_024813 [Dermacentor silvarum]